MHLVKQCHDFIRRPAVQIPGRLISQQQSRLTDQRARYRNPLLLTARKSPRLMG